MRYVIGFDQGVQDQSCVMLAKYDAKGVMYIRHVFYFPLSLEERVLWWWWRLRERLGW